MDNHFTITIHDDNGVKQIHLHKFVKKVLLYSFSFIALFIIIAVSMILYLDASIDTITEKKNGVENAYNQLTSNLETTKTLLVDKKQELDELSDSLSEIQTMIGLKVDKDALSLHKRVDLTMLNSEQMATLLQLVPNGSPIEYHGITSKFGYRTHPTLHRREFHRGTDLKAKMNTPVYAPADGIVEFAGMHKKSGFGRLIILTHAFGFKTYYGHLHKVVAKSTRFVRKGELIGYTGTSGMSNGPHLHYEIRYLFNVLNPYWFIKWNVKNYHEIFKKEQKVPWQSLVTATTNLKVTNPTQTLPLLQREQK